jgi:hypothetical protein
VIPQPDDDVSIAGETLRGDEGKAGGLVGGKWLCVVVKYEENDAFVVTAYLTDKPKAGEDLWPTK